MGKFPFFAFRKQGMEPSQISKCSACGEYVFERYVRTKDGQPVCIPCSGY